MNGFQMIGVICTMVVILPAAACVICGCYWYYHSHDILIDRWLDNHRYRLIRKKARRFGSPWILVTPVQRRYYIVVEDKEGRILHGWALSGGAIRGFLSGEVEVCWECD